MVRVKGKWDEPRYVFVLKPAQALLDAPFWVRTAALYLRSIG